MTQKISINDPSVVGMKRRIPCIRCANPTNHVVVAQAERSLNDENAFYSEHFEIVQCCGCDSISFRADWQSSEDMEVDDDGVQVAVVHEELFPSRNQGRKLLRDLHFVPGAVVQIYRETYFAICNEQRILAGIGIRALVEAVCKQKAAGGHDLQKRIDDLAAKGILTKDSAEVLHACRFLGNEAAHEVKPPDPSVLAAAMDVAEHLLLTVYVMPEVAKRLPKPEPRKQPKKVDS